MRGFKNNRFIQVLTWFLALLVIGVNIYMAWLSFDSVTNSLLYIPISIMCVVWVGFYLLLGYYASGATFLGCWSCLKRPEDVYDVFVDDELAVPALHADQREEEEEEED